jgi:hypothetical protein
MHHLGNRFIGLSASGEFPGAGVLTATVALKAASSGLQFSSVHTWLSCKSPRSKGASANGNLHNHLYRTPGSRISIPFSVGLQEKTIRPVLVVHSENTVTLPHMAPGARCSRGLSLCYTRDLRPLRIFPGDIPDSSPGCGRGVSPPNASRNPRCALWPRELHTDTLPYSRNGVLSRRPDYQVPGYQTVIARVLWLGCIRVISTAYLWLGKRKEEMGRNNSSEQITPLGRR